MPYHAYKKGPLFRVVHESWHLGKRTRRSVPKKEWPGLGFDRCTTLEEAREVGRHLNSVERQEFLRNRAIKRVERHRAEAYVFLPPRLLARFEEDVGKKFREAHWLAAKKAIKSIGIPPSEWYRRAHLFTDWFITKRYSPDYSKRIIRLINEWGYFFAQQNGGFWRPIPFPRGAALRKIRSAYYTKGRGPSRRLFFADLKLARKEFSEPEYNWLLLTVAFGLRPEEADQGSDKVYLEGNSVVCFQPKMVRMGEREKHWWKRIPIKLKFQRVAAGVLNKRRSRPWREKLRTVFGKGVSYYAGRRAFAPYMQKRGFDAYTVAKWMGHKGLETMRRHYDDEAA